MPVFLRIRIRLDLVGCEVDGALVVADTVRVKVAVKIVFPTLTAEAKEEEEGEDGDGCDTTYCAANDGACM